MNLMNEHVSEEGNLCHRKDLVFILCYLNRDEEKMQRTMREIFKFYYIYSFFLWNVCIIPDL